MFKKLEGLDPEKHADLKMKAVGQYHFAARSHLLPTVIAEAGLVSKYFPIVFLQGAQMMPQIVCSLSQGQNAFVDDGGNWLAGYIPAAVRRYPFVLGQTANPGEFAVMIDRDAPHFSETEGQPLFDPDKQMTEQVKKIIDFLNQIQKETQITNDLCGQLKEQGVLEDKNFDIHRRNEQGEEKPLRVTGFQFINLEKVKALDSGVLKNWVENGLLQLIYLHLNSLSNFQNLAGSISAT